MVGARNIRPARDSIERRVVFATSEVFGIFIRWFSGRAAYNEYSVLQYSRNMKFSGFDMLQYGIFVIGCPPAEPSDENSEHFTSSEDNSSLNTVPRRPDVSSPDHPSTSLSGRRLVEGTDFQQL